MPSTALQSVGNPGLICAIMTERTASSIIFILLCCLVWDAHDTFSEVLGNTIGRCLVPELNNFQRRFEHFLQQCPATVILRGTNI